MRGASGLFAALVFLCAVPLTAAALEFDPDGPGGDASAEIRDAHLLPGAQPGEHVRHASARPAFDGL